jgi:hypothetical protein
LVSCNETVTEKAIYLRGSLFNFQPVHDWISPRRAATTLSRATPMTRVRECMMGLLD